MSDRTPQTQKAIALPQTLKKRFLRSASLSHISKPQNSDRTPTPQQRSHPLHPKTAIAPSQHPKQRSHYPNFRRFLGRASLSH
ncbi:MAG: hypothetical protein ACKPFI_04945 [Dolichospermum sp.]